MEAGRNVKVEGKENNLLELIAADPAFPMGLEELKASMDPSKYIGRSKEQVEAFLKNVIHPILEANQRSSGRKGRDQCINRNHIITEIRHLTRRANGGFLRCGEISERAGDR